MTHPTWRHQRRCAGTFPAIDGPPRGGRRPTPPMLLAGLLLTGLAMMPRPGLARPPSWAIGPEASRTLQRALEDPAVKRLLPPGWQVESLTIGATSVELRLRPSVGTCVIGVLRPRAPGESRPNPVTWTGCPEGGEAPDDSLQPSPFAEALRDRLGPEDLVAVGARDGASEEVPRGPPLGLLLTLAGIQFLLLLGLSILALRVLASAPGQSAHPEPPPDGPRPSPEVSR